MKVGVSLPEDLLKFADEESNRRGTTRSGLIADLLEAERIRTKVSQYIDEHGWDVVEDAPAWRDYQKRRMKEEYGSDDW